MSGISNVGYTIKSGDCLWNIIKNNYKKDGQALSNKEIAGIVQKIANDNDNIKDANLIFTGDQIKLNNYDGFELQIKEEEEEIPEETPKTVDEEKKAETKEETKTIYDDFNSWASKNSTDFTGIDTTLSPEKQEKAFKEIENRTFSYNSDNTEESRKAGLEELVSSQIAAYDLDGDNGINLKEYLMGEVAEYNDNTEDMTVQITEEMIDDYLAEGNNKLTNSEAEELLAGLERSFNFFNFNYNGTLDKNELIAYYNILDTSVDGVQDGKFDYSTYLYWGDLSSAGKGDSLEASREKRKSELDKSYKTAHPGEFA